MPVASESVKSAFPVRAVFRHFLELGSATYVSRLLAAFRGIINARWLGPEHYGFWGSISFLVSFGFHLHGGTQDAMIKQIPTFQSQGRAEQAKESAEQAFSFFTLMLFAASVFLAVYALLLPESVSLFQRCGWWLAAVTLPLEALFLFEQHILRCEGKFKELHQGILLTTFLSLILTLALVTQFRIWGLFIVAVLTPFFGLFYLHAKAGYTWRFKFNFPMIKAMLKMGWPILTMTVIYEMLWWVDRILVLSFLSHADFGYYAFGFMVLQLCSIFPDVLAAVVEPKLYSDYAKNNNATDVRDHLWFPIKLVSLTLPFAVLTLHFALPFLIHFAFPAYKPGIPVIQVLLWGSIFKGMMSNTKSLIVALGKQKQALPLYFLPVVINITLSTFLAWKGYGLVGIALGTVAAYVVGAAELLAFAFKEMGETVSNIAVKILSLYTPAMITLVGVLVIPSWSQFLSAQDSNILFQSLKALPGFSCFLFLGFLMTREYLRYSPNFKPEVSV